MNINMGLLNKNNSKQICIQEILSPALDNVQDLGEKVICKVHIFNVKKSTLDGKNKCHER